MEDPSILFTSFTVIVEYIYHKSKKFTIEKCRIAVYDTEWLNINYDCVAIQWYRPSKKPNLSVPSSIAAINGLVTGRFTRRGMSL